MVHHQMISIFNFYLHVWLLLLHVCQPAAKFSTMAATDNRQFYSGKVNADLPDLFPLSSNDSYTKDFDEWFHKINQHVDGLFGRGHQNRTKSKFYGKFHAFPGGFHAGMKLHNCCGRMFGNFLIVFFGVWHNSLPKIHYIFYPLDPRHLENKLLQ